MHSSWVLASAGLVLALLLATATATADELQLECRDYALEFDTIAEMDIEEREGDIAMYRRMLVQFFDPSTSVTFVIAAGHQGLHAPGSNDGVGALAVTVDGVELPESLDGSEGSFVVHEGDRELRVATYFSERSSVTVEYSYLLRRPIGFPMTQPFAMSKDVGDFTGRLDLIPSLDLCVQQFTFTLAMVTVEPEYGKPGRASIEYRVSVDPLITKVKQHVHEPTLVVVTKAWNEDGEHDPLPAHSPTHVNLSLRLMDKDTAVFKMGNWQRLEATYKIGSALACAAAIVLPLIAFISRRVVAGTNVISRGRSSAEAAKLYQETGLQLQDVALLDVGELSPKAVRLSLLDAATRGDVRLSEKSGELYMEAEAGGLWATIVGTERRPLLDITRLALHDTAVRLLVPDAYKRLRSRGMVWITPKFAVALSWMIWLLCTAAAACLYIHPFLRTMMYYFVHAAISSRSKFVEFSAAFGSIVTVLSFSSGGNSTCRTQAGGTVLSRWRLAAATEVRKPTGAVGARGQLALALLAQPSTVFLERWASAAAPQLAVPESALVRFVNTL